MLIIYFNVHYCKAGEENMKKLNFIPYWYKEYRKDKKIKLVKPLIILFFMCDFLLIAVFIHFFKAYKDLSMRSLPVFSSERDDKKDMEKLIISKKIMSNLKMFTCCSEQNIIINKAFINSEDVEINAEVKNIEEYYSFIKYIENSSTMHIKNLSIPHAADKEALIFNVLLEVKN